MFYFLSYHVAIMQLFYAMQFGLHGSEKDNTIINDQLM